MFKFRFFIDKIQKVTQSILSGEEIKIKYVRLGKVRLGKVR